MDTRDFVKTLDDDTVPFFTGKIVDKTGGEMSMFEKEIREDILRFSSRKFLRSELNDLFKFDLVKNGTVAIVDWA